jgi:hypothetical protein
MQMDPNQKEIMESLTLVVNANTVLQANFTSSIGKKLSVGNVNIAGAQTNTIKYQFDRSQQFVGFSGTQSGSGFLISGTV